MSADLEGESRAGGVAAGSTPSTTGATSPWRGTPEAIDPNKLAPHPARVGRYRLDRLLGRGGFGCVYLGFDDQLSRAVAVKIAHPGRVDTAERADAFLAEARALARVDHPNVLPVYDAGRDGDSCFVVSRYVEGRDLSERLANGPVPWAEAVRIAGEVARALHHAHSRGVVHRDVKPNNILLDPDGKSYLADFGLALREEDFGSGSGYAGTPAYMSPEQAAGRGHIVDGRSDVFSLGVVLYEMLTGRNPFRAATAEETSSRITTIDPRPPRQVNDALPLELERVCLKALAKPLAERYTTAKDLADDLARVSGVGLPAPVRARRRLGAVAFAGLVLVAAAVAVAVFLPRDPASVPPTEVPPTPEVVKQLPTGPAEVPVRPIEEPVRAAEEAPAPRPIIVRALNPRWLPCLPVLPLTTLNQQAGLRQPFTEEERAGVIPGASITSLNAGRLAVVRGPRECLFQFELRVTDGVEWVRVESIEIVVARYRPLPRYAYDTAPPPGPGSLLKKDCEPAEDAEDGCPEEKQETEQLYYVEITRPTPTLKNAFRADAYFNVVTKRPLTLSRSDLQFLRVGQSPEPVLVRVNARTAGVYDLECWVTTSYENVATRRQVGPRATYLFDGKFTGILVKKD